MYGLCGGKGNSANICANTVTVLACEDAKVSDGKTLSGEKDEAFVCNLPGKSFDGCGERGYIVLV